MVMINVSTFICNSKFIIEYQLSDALNIQGYLDSNDIQQLMKNTPNNWLDSALEMARIGQPVLNWRFSTGISGLPDQIYLSLSIWLAKVLIRLSDQPIPSFFHDVVNKLEPGSDSGIELTARPGEETLNKYTQLNNEITAIQRELQKKNADLEVVNKKLHYLATTDFLTDIFNRREIFERADVEMERAKRENFNFGLALLDLDNFKEINDTYGHHMGDITLVKLAGLMRSSIRGYDAVGRIGGDEFLIFFSLKSEKQLRSILGRLHEKIQGVVITTDDGLSFEPKASIGAVCYSALQHEDITIKDLLVYADEALYKSKESGGDQITFSDCEKSNS